MSDSRFPISNSVIDRQIANIDAQIASEQAVLDVLSDNHNHAEIKLKIDIMQKDRQKLESWKITQRNDAPCNLKCAGE